MSSPDFVAPKLTIRHRDEFVHPGQQEADVVAARLGSVHPRDLVTADGFGFAPGLTRELSVLHPAGLMDAPHLLQDPLSDSVAQKVVHDAESVRLHARGHVLQHEFVRVETAPLATGRPVAARLSQLPRHLVRRRVFP